MVLTCYANSTSQTQIIPSLISRLARASGPANDSTWLRDCNVHGDASGRTCYKAGQTGDTNPACQNLRQDLLGAHLVHTVRGVFVFPAPVEDRYEAVAPRLD